jgi:hypothetical protein
MMRDGEGNRTCEGLEDFSRRSRSCDNDRHNDSGSFYRQIKYPMKRYHNRWQRRRARSIVKHLIYAFNQKS